MLSTSNWEPFLTKQLWSAGASVRSQLFPFSYWISVWFTMPWNTFRFTRRKNHFQTQKFHRLYQSESNLSKFPSIITEKLITIIWHIIKIRFLWIFVTSPSIYMVKIFNFINFSPFNGISHRNRYLKSIKIRSLASLADPSSDGRRLRLAGYVNIAVAYQKYFPRSYAV